jgi:hypothetical protein
MKRYELAGREPTCISCNSSPIVEVSLFSYLIMTAFYRECDTRKPCFDNAEIVSAVTDGHVLADHC